MKNILLMLMAFICSSCTGCVSVSQEGYTGHKALLRAVGSTVAIGSFLPVYEDITKLPKGTKPKIIGANFQRYGTGVVVKGSGSSNIILTAEHVAMLFYPLPAYACSIVNESCVPLGSKLMLELDSLPHDLGSDWAMYNVEKLPKGTQSVKFSKRSILLGEPLWAIGIPYGRSPRISKGQVSWIQDAGRGNKLIAVDGFAAPGFSGGGMFTMNGVLVGLTIAIEMNSRGEPSTDQVLMIPLSNIWGLN